MKEVLQNKTVKELTEICKENKIQHYKKNRKLNKAELIDAIIASGVNVENNESVKDEKEIKGAVVKENAETVEDESASTSGKECYLQNLELGTIVAITINAGKKVISAKVVKKSTTKKKLMCETSYGQQYIVDWEDVLWVKTGNRWPKGVYRLFSGNDKKVGSDNEESEFEK